MIGFKGTPEGSQPFCVFPKKRKHTNTRSPIQNLFKSKGSFLEIAVVLVFGALG